MKLDSKPKNKIKGSGGVGGAVRGMYYQKHDKTIDSPKSGA